jgi:hypothetical protein
MKENQSIKSNIQNHPSFESKFKPQKPSIKYICFKFRVEYKVIHSSPADDKNKKREGKKLFGMKKSNQTSFLNTSNTTH